MKQNLNKTIGQIIRKKRESLNLTQTNLAQKLGYGSPQFVSLFERGFSAVPLETLGKITKILDIRERVFLDLLLDHYKRELDSRIKAGKKKAKTA